MTFYSVPDTLTKLTQLGDVTLFEPDGDTPRTDKKLKSEGRDHQTATLMDCISYVTTPQGKKPVMKTMVTTACERNCYYCPFRAGRSKTRRVTFTPDELASAFDTLQRKKAVDGMFLSSGIIKGSVTTQDKIIDTAEIIRRKYQYTGYIHLKIMPGAEYDQILRAMQIADRVSVNLEGPTQQRLEMLAPKKDFLKELVTMLNWAEHIRRDHPHQKLASTVTQFVVGAVGDTDLELLATSEKLYRQTRIRRAYYSAFHPVPQTPFENLTAEADRRENRLYQASFLLRDYEWTVEDFLFGAGGNLDLERDPKQAWADRYLRQSPVEIMSADRLQLMRIPGIGKIGAEAILKARRKGNLVELAHLRQAGVHNVERAAPYILLNGKRPPVQPRLFEEWHSESDG